MPSLYDLRAADGTRQFGSLRETYDAVHPQWHALRAHVAALPGGVVTDFVTDDVTEAWIDFAFRGHRFSINNQAGEWRFFVDDPACPDAILRDVLAHCERLLAPTARAAVLDARKVRVELGELPEPLARAIRAEGFLFAFALPERGRYIVRHVAADGRPEELEYDASLGRCLALDERRRELPDEESLAPGEERVTVRCTYAFEQPSGNLRVLLDIRDESGASLARVERQVYDPTPWQVVAVVRAALHLDYLSWSREQRVGYWATTIHRWRRANGDHGWDEDEVYTPELVRDMECVDPRVRELLDEILTLVGRLEQTEPAEAIAAFVARTGVTT